MNKYFAKVTVDHWTAKNTLQADAKQFARDMERVIIHSDEELLAFIDTMDRGLQELNQKHSRCTALQASKYMSDQHRRDPGYQVSNVFWMAFYKIKEVPNA